MKIRKICFVTGSRAEYGLMSLLIKSINDNPSMELEIVATGMHLSSDYGLTFQEIERDGFTIDHKVEMLLLSDSQSSISKSIGQGIIGFADLFDKYKPDILLIHGDRYEILSAAIAAMNFFIPIAHVAGGELTMGSLDDITRHTLTKMSWWHFVSNSTYKNRVIQLGEDPRKVFNVGDLGVYSINNKKLLSKKELYDNIDLKFRKKNLIITYHPEALDPQTSKKNFQALLYVLNQLKNIFLIFTMPNSDSNGRIIKNMIDKFVSSHKEHSVSFTSMGHLNYISTLQFIDGVVGNSSSGISEAPSFKIGTINIGDRQKGRMKAKSIIDCEPKINDIKKSIDKLYSTAFQNNLSSVVNPYDGGNTVDKIINVLSDYPIPDIPKKEFYDL